VNELLLQKNSVLGFGRLVTTEYRVLPRSIAEPSIGSALKIILFLNS